MKDDASSNLFLEVYSSYLVLCECEDSFNTSVSWSSPLQTLAWLCTDCFKSRRVLDKTRFDYCSPLTKEMSMLLGCRLLIPASIPVCPVKLCSSFSQTEEGC